MFERIKMQTIDTIFVYTISMEYNNSYNAILQLSKRFKDYVFKLRSLSLMICNKHMSFLFIGVIILMS